MHKSPNTHQLPRAFPLLHTADLHLGVITKLHKICKAHREMKVQKGERMSSTNFQYDGSATSA